MAAVPLISINTQTLARIKDLCSRYKKWAELPDADKNYFQSVFLLNQGFFGNLPPFEFPQTAYETFATALENGEDLEDFFALKEAPLTDQAVVDTALLANLISLMRQEQAETEAQLAKSHPHATKDQIRLIMKIRALQLARAEKYRIPPALQQELNSIVNQINPKEDLQTPVIYEAAAIATAAIASVADITTIAPQKIDQAAAIITTAAAVFDNFYDPLTKKPTPDLALATELAIQAAVPNYVSPITQLADQISQATTTATASDHIAQATHPETPAIINSTTNTILHLPNITIPENVDLTPSLARLETIIQTDHLIPDHIENLDTKVKDLSAKFTDLTAAAAIVTTLTPPLPEAVVNEIIHIATQQFPNQVVIPSWAGSQTIGFVKTIPANPNLTPAGVKIYASGLKFENLLILQQQAAAAPASPIGKIFNNPSFAKQISEAIATVHNIQSAPAYDSTTQRNFGNDIHQPLSGLSARFQGFTNRISGFLPTRLSQPLNFVLHPIASVRSYIGQRTGQFIARQFMDRLGRAAMQKAGQLLLKSGLAAGLKNLATQVALKAAGKVAAQLAIKLALGSAGGPIGLAIAALATVGQFLLEKLFKEPDKVAMAPIAGLAAVSGLLAPAAAAPGSLASSLTGAAGAAVVVGASVAGTILTAIIAFLILYLTAFTAAPLISTLAQLQSGIGAQQGVGGPLLPSYTGPILPGCPSFWPIPSGLVIQGPHGSYSHALVEGIDILTPIGTPVKSLTDGTVTAAGQAPPASSAYGNWIWIESTSSDGRKFTVVYAHLSEVRVQVGNKVQNGSIIALSGNTSSVARFNNPHLHVEYRGIPYNSCPAGGVQIPNGCYGSRPSEPNSCTINGRPITF